MLSVEDIKDLGHSRKVSLMTKIGNGNGLLCRLHSKPHTVRAQNTLRRQWHFIYSFPKTDPAISKHLKNIFEEGELDKEVVVSKMEITTQHGALELTKFNDFAQPPQHRVATAIKPSCHHVIMSSCHHAVKDFSMVHNDKSKGTRRQRRRVPCWLSKEMQSIPVCLGSKEGRG